MVPRNMRDNDNIEVKTFIDAAIKGIFIRDDTPDCLSLCFDFVEDEKEYTEAYLGNFGNMVLYLK